MGTVKEKIEAAKKDLEENRDKYIDELKDLWKKVNEIRTYKFWKNEVDRKKAFKDLSLLGYDKQLTQYLEKNNIKQIQRFLNIVIDKMKDAKKKELENYLAGKGIWLNSGHVSEDNRFCPQTLETLDFIVSNKKSLLSEITKAAREVENGTQTELTELKSDVKLFNNVSKSELEKLINSLDEWHKEKVFGFYKAGDIKWLQTYLNENGANLGTPDWKLWKKTFEAIKELGNKSNSGNENKTENSNENKTESSTENTNHYEREINNEMKRKIVNLIKEKCSDSLDVNSSFADKESLGVTVDRWFILSTRLSYPNVQNVYMDIDYDKFLDKNWNFKEDDAKKIVEEVKKKLLEQRKIARLPVLLKNRYGPKSAWLSRSDLFWNEYEGWNVTMDAKLDKFFRFFSDDRLIIDRDTTYDIDNLKLKLDLDVNGNNKNKLCHWETNSDLVVDWLDLLDDRLELNDSKFKEKLKSIIIKLVDKNEFEKL